MPGSGTASIRPCGKDDRLAVAKLDRLARSIPNARAAIADRLQERGLKLALGRALCDPGDLMGRMFLRLLATEMAGHFSDWGMKGALVGSPFRTVVDILDVVNTA